MLSNFQSAFDMIVQADAELLQIIILSLKVSLSSTVIAAFIGLPMSAWLSFSQFYGRQAAITLVNALLGMPSVVLGLAFYLLLSRAGPLGKYGLLYTPTAMIIAQICLVVPIIIALARQHMEVVYRHQSDLFYSLRMSKFQIIRTLIFEARFALVTVLLTAFGRAISEVGAVMVVGGNINHSTRVMTTTIAMETNKGNLSLALSLGVVLMSIVLTINILASWTHKFNRA